ncbi:MAG: hypothetical protein OXM55_04930 [Bdellovibrionales bacterium]|nr:hypothetical protein [Bdellovibrionales bacterium]
MYDQGNFKSKKNNLDDLDFSKKDIPPILCFSDQKNDDNFQNVQPRDKIKYLREQYWIKQWSPKERWKKSSLVSFAGWSQLNFKGLDHKPDDPGDAFFDLFLPTDTFLLSCEISVRIWVEVTEAFLSREHAMRINQFMRDLNGLHQKQEADEYIKSFITSSIPDSRLQYEMADRVIALIKKKAQKGKDGGSYQKIVSDYGTGVLIVGIPLWFATFPENPEDPKNALNNFMTRLSIGLESIKSSVLNKSWCPFDSIYVVWNPNVQSACSWAKIADIDSYSNPSKVSLIPILLPKKAHSFLKNRDLRDFLSKTKSLGHFLRVDKYSSLNKALKKQNQFFWLFKYPKPFGPKSCLIVTEKERRSIKEWFSLFFLTKCIKLYVVIKIYGFLNFCKIVRTRKLSPMYFLKQLYLKQKMKKLYHHSNKKI